MRTRASNAEMANRRRYLEAHVQGAPRGTGCWEWPFKTNTDGYGMLKSRERVHVLALELDGRPKPHAKAEARHSCDNRPCFNPSHLSWGTTQDNTRDRNSRNRQNKGSDVNTAKLTEDDVRYIRAHWRPRKGADMGNSAELALRFGIDRTNVWAVATGRKWSHVK